MGEKKSKKEEEKLLNETEEANNNNDLPTFVFDEKKMFLKLKKKKEMGEPFALGKISEEIYNELKKKYDREDVGRKREKKLKRKK